MIHTLASTNNGYHRYHHNCFPLIPELGQTLAVSARGLGVVGFQKKTYTT